MFDIHQHTLPDTGLKSIVQYASDFFDTTPVSVLPPPQSFIGVGVYAVYYSGDFGPYHKIAAANSDRCVLPIYVGKAVPRGRRTARTTETESADLYGRLNEHSSSINAAVNLRVSDFKCRFMILKGLDTDLIVPLEATLIRRFKPLWNHRVDGFGNHDPGARRYGGILAKWDTLHPGRPWVEKWTGPIPARKPIIEEIEKYLESTLLS